MVMCGHADHDTGEPRSHLDDGAEDAAGRAYPSPGAFASNLSRDMPAGRKLKLILRNNALKIVRLRPCCGHPGEPGC